MSAIQTMIDRACAESQGFERYKGGKERAREGDKYDVKERAIFKDEYSVCERILF